MPYLFLYSFYIVTSLGDSISSVRVSTDLTLPTLSPLYPTNARFPSVVPSTVKLREYILRIEGNATLILHYPDMLDDTAILFTYNVHFKLIFLLCKIYQEIGYRTTGIIKNPYDLPLRSTVMDHRMDSSLVTVTNDSDE